MFVVTCASTIGGVDKIRATIERSAHRETCFMKPVGPNFVVRVPIIFSHSWKNRVDQAPSSYLPPTRPRGTASIPDLEESAQSEGRFTTISPSAPRRNLRISVGPRHGPSLESEGP